MAEWVWHGLEALQIQLLPLVSSKISILLLGEPGTGKTELAQWIHAKSNRSSHLFQKFSIANIPDQTAESELFGHERGAFTGADRSKKGLFRTAEKGTVFIDELGEATPAMQAKLLNVLNNKSIRPLGWHGEEIRVDVRLIFATNRDLNALVAAKLFRDDLQSRIRPPVFRLPPLRERVESIVPIFRHLLRKEFLAERQTEPPPLSDELRYELERRHWPGNAREVKKVVELLVAFKRGVEPFDVADLMALPMGENSAAATPADLDARGALAPQGNEEGSNDQPLPADAPHGVIGHVAQLCVLAALSDERDRSVVREMALRIVSHSDWRDPNAPSCVKARLELFKNLRVCPGWPLRKQLQAALAAVVKWDLERRDEPMVKACIQREFCKALSKTGREPAFWKPILTWLVPSDDASRRGVARQARRERRA